MGRFCVNLWALHSLRAFEGNYATRPMGRARVFFHIAAAQKSTPTPETRMQTRVFGNYVPRVEGPPPVPVHSAPLTTT